MRDLSATQLTASSKQLSVKPSIPWVFTSGVTSYTYDTDRIIRVEHSEAHDSHKAELILQNSDGTLTSLDLKGYSIAPKWGLITSAGSETSETAPLWVRDMTLHSVRGKMIARLTCFGIPDRLDEDKANDNYHHHSSSVKTVKDLVTEVASGVAVSEELTESQDTTDGSIDLNATTVGGISYTVHGVGQKITIPNREITKISFKLKKTGSPAGTNVTFKIRATDDDTILASKTFPIASIGATLAWCEATLASPVTVNEEVWIYCEHVDGDAGNYVSVAYNSVGVKIDENLTIVDSVAGPVELGDLECAYRYKYNYAGISVYDHCAAWDVTYDSEDSLIDVYTPADAFFIREGESRLNVIDKLLAYTGCERMFKADGKMHVLVPTISGVVYDYEYSLASGEHGFFSKSLREALVIPNKQVVKSYDDDETQYTGSYTSAASYALMPISGEPVRTKLASNAQAISIATAMISRLEVASQRGSCTVPMNVGAEIWDYVKVTDARQGDSRTGNIGYITRVYDGRNYQMTFGFGGVAVKKIPGTQLAELNTIISEFDMMAEENVKWGAILPTLKQTAIAIDKMQKTLKDILTGLGYYDNDLPVDDQIDTALIGYLKNLIEDTSPQLGGTLDVNGKTIKELTGILHLDGKTFVYLDVDGTRVFSVGPTGIDSQQPLSMSTNKITNVVDPTADQEAATKKYVDDNTDLVNDTSPQLGGNLDVNTKTINLLTANSDVTASRALDTVYQNTGGYPLLVVVTLSLDNAEDVAVYVELSDVTPDVLVAECQNTAGGNVWMPVSFIVPIGAYYTLTKTGAPAIVQWTETTIGA